MGQRVSHASLSSKVDHPIEPMFGKHMPHGFGIGQIGAHESPRSLSFSGLIAESTKTRLLQAWIVIVIDNVEPHHIVAAGEQISRSVKADKPCGAGYEDLHVTAAHRFPLWGTFP